MRRTELEAKAIALHAAGRLHDADDHAMEDVFRGSVDRFVEIAERLQGRRRVLDVGSGHGQLLALLHALGHECHGGQQVHRSAEKKGSEQKCLKVLENEAQDQHLHHLPRGHQ